MNPYFNYNALPPQQILQANGKASIDALRMSPNSSVLIADQTAPIVWRCVSDSLGNVTAEAFDITPHKSEAQEQQDMLTTIEQRLKRLEENYEPIIERLNQSEHGKGGANVERGQGRKKSAGDRIPDDDE